MKISDAGQPSTAHQSHAKKIEFKKGIVKMAKDGTARGGARVGAGRKSKSLQEKILDGQVADFQVKTSFNDGYEPAPPKEYLTTEQKSGGKLCAELIYKETYQWLKAVGCEKIVTKQLVEDYSLAVARKIQCEEILSKFGLLAKHPTTGEPTTSPFVKMGNDYSKQATQFWCQIYAIVKENNSKGQFILMAQSETMDQLLRRVK